jgi:hypothetical protein
VTYRSNKVPCLVKILGNCPAVSPLNSIYFLGNVGILYFLGNVNGFTTVHFSVTEQTVGVHFSFFEASR